MTLIRDVLLVNQSTGYNRCCKSDCFSVHCSLFEQKGSRPLLCDDSEDKEDEEPEADTEPEIKVCCLCRI